MQADPAHLREFAARYTAAWCSHDPAGVAGFFAPGGSLTVNSGAPAVGRAEIAELAQSFMTTFPDLQVLMDDLVVQPGCIEYHWTPVGTNTGPGGTGYRVRVSGVERWQIGESGLIDSSDGSFDFAEYRRQLECGASE